MFMVHRKLARLMLTGIAAAVAISGCSSSTATNTPAASVNSSAAASAAPTSAINPTGDTLTIAQSSAPLSLDPMLAGIDQISSMYLYGSYDSLTRLDKDGKVAPDLATSWAWTDAGRLTFQLTLRSGVKFSDGSPLTSVDVVAGLEYCRTKGVDSAWVSAIDSVTAQGDNTVVIHSTTPIDALPYMLSQRLFIGMVMQAKAAKDPALLKTATYGAGPYMLDPSQTVANNTYTYVPNPYYWDPAKIQWRKIVLKVVADQNAALQAVLTGAAQLFSGNQPTATAAQNNGLVVATAAFGITGILIADRNGEVVPALKNPLVRQALMMAIDRPAIQKAVYGGFSAPSASLILKTQDGYTGTDDSAFPYDMAKAKELLKTAGYENGFSFDMSTPTANNTNLMAQAVIASWSQLGVKVNLQTYTDLGLLTTDVLAKKYPVSAFNYGTLPTYVQSLSFISAAATQFNAWGLADDQALASLKAATIASTEQAKNEAYAAAWHRATVDLASFTAVYVRQQVTIYDPKKISGVLITSASPVVDYAWSVVPMK